MHRLIPPFAALALTGGLLGFTPQATADTPDCADPAHPIVEVLDFDVVVGTKKVKTTPVAVYTAKDCGVDHAVAVVTSAHRTYRITLEKGADDPGSTADRWAGTLRVDPARLRNSDAGVWPVRYEVGGDTSESTSVDGQVRRATRATFNAGPEPVRNNKITFAGRLERADWNRRQYRGVAKTVEIKTLDAEEKTTTVAKIKTKSNGKYRKTQAFPGVSKYWMTYGGTTATGPTSTAADWVDKI